MALRRGEGEADQQGEAARGERDGGRQFQFEGDHRGQLLPDESQGRRRDHPGDQAREPRTPRPPRRGRNQGRCDGGRRLVAKQGRAAGRRHGRGKPTTQEPVLQPPTPARQAALHGPERPVKLVGRLFVRQALQTA